MSNGQVDIFKKKICCISERIWDLPFATRVITACKSASISTITSYWCNYVNAPELYSISTDAVREIVDDKLFYGMS